MVCTLSFGVRHGRQIKSQLPSMGCVQKFPPFACRFYHGLSHCWRAGVARITYASSGDRHQLFIRSDAKAHNQCPLVSGLLRYHRHP